MYEIKYYRYCLFSRLRLKGENLGHVCRYIDGSNRLAVCREFIKIQDVGQEQIPVDCRFQAACCVISLVFFLSFFFWKKDQNIRLKTSSGDERFSDIFRYFQIEMSSYCPRDLYQRIYIYSLWCCIILRCHCSVLRSPRDSNWNRMTAILTLRLSNPCATTMR